MAWICATKFFGDEGSKLTPGFQFLSGRRRSRRTEIGANIGIGGDLGRVGDEVVDVDLIGAGEPRAHHGCLLSDFRRGASAKHGEREKD